jgi:glucose-6-phosphate isomerase
LLEKIAKDIHLDSKVEEMFKGEPINKTENRKVLHTKLREPIDSPLKTEETEKV